MYKSQWKYRRGKDLILPGEVKKKKRLIRQPSFLTECYKEFGRYMRGCSQEKGSMKDLQPVRSCIDRKEYLFGRATP